MARLADVQYRIYADFVSIETGNRLGSSLFSISRDRFVSGSHTYIPIPGLHRGMVRKSPNLC